VLSWHDSANSVDSNDTAGLDTAIMHMTRVFAAAHLHHAYDDLAA
jgi:hypothetical protein